MTEFDDQDVLRAAFETAPVPMALSSIDDDGHQRIVRANNALCLLLGYEQAELEGRRWIELAHPAPSEAVAADDLGWLERIRHWRHAKGYPIVLERHTRSLDQAGPNAVTIDHLIETETTDLALPAETEREAVAGALAKARARELTEVKQRLNLSLDAAQMRAWTYDIANEEFNSYPSRPQQKGFRDGDSLDAIIARFSADEQAKLRSAVTNAIKTDQPFRVTVCIDEGDNARWIEVVGDTIKTKDAPGRLIAGVTRDVTAELAATRDEQRQRTQLDMSASAAGFGTWELDGDTEQYTFDARSMEILGLDQPIKTRSEVAAAFHLEDRPKLANAVSAAVSDSTPIDFVARLHTPDRPFRWVRYLGRPVSNGHQEQRMVGLIQDITEERRLLEISRTRERRLQVALQAGQLAVVEWDPELESGWVDNSGGTLPGAMGTGRVPLKKFEDYTHPDDVEMRRQLRRAFTTTNDLVEETLRLEIPGKGTIWTRSSGLGFEDPATGRRRVIGVMKDITAAQLAKLELEHRAGKLELALTSTRTTIDEFDFATGESVMSDDFYQSLGYDPEQVQADGFQPESLVHPDDLPELLEQRVRFIEGWSPDRPDETWEHLFRVRHKNGTWRWILTRSRVAEWDDRGIPTRAIGANSDITERRRLEQQLTHNATMQALASFSAGIAHDFNNIMAIVQGHTEALLHRDLDARERARRLTVVLTSVERAKTLVSDLMRMIRPNPSSDLVVDVVETVRQVGESLPILVGEDISIHLDLTIEPTPVRLEPARLESILLNIVANSRDAMPTGGQITVNVAVDPETTDPAPGQHRMVRLDVTDTGSGMSANTLESMFEPFFTTKSPGVGTGLGMATTYDTIRLAGGTMTAESAIGEGTTIRVALPHAGVAVVAPAASEQRRALGTTGTILVVEDNAELLELVADVLRDAGHRVHEALGGHEALEILEGDHIDLVLTDVVMPLMSGVDLAATINERWPTMRILFQSGYSADAPAATHIDERDIIYKPATEAELLQRVADVLGAAGPRAG